MRLGYRLGRLAQVQKKVANGEQAYGVADVIEYYRVDFSPPDAMECLSATTSSLSC